MKSLSSTLVLALVMVAGTLLTGGLIYILLSHGSVSPILQEDPPLFPRGRAAPSSDPAWAPKETRDGTDAGSVDVRETAQGDEGLAIPSQRLPLPTTLLTSSILGEVVDEEGCPVEKAKITLVSILPDFLQTMLPLGGFETSDWTDSSGAFAVPVPDGIAFVLSVEKEGYAGFQSETALPNDRLTITLARGVGLEGTVLEDATRLPLEHALVYTESASSHREARTGGDGAFVLKDLAEGRIDLHVFQNGFDLRTLRSVFVQRDGNGRIEIVLKRGTEISGVVLDRETGNPVSGADVEYVIDHRENDEIRELFREGEKTDRNGYFAFHEVSRNGYRIQVTASGYASLTLKPRQLKQETDAPPRIFLHKESAITGRVLDPSGQQIEGAALTVYQTSGLVEEVLNARSDEKGGFYLSPVADGWVRVHGDHPSFCPSSSEKIHVPPGTTSNEFEITLWPPAVIEGTVLDETGEPVGGARVVIDGIDPSRARLFGIYPCAVTDGEGVFAFDRLQEGDYRIAAYKDDSRGAVTTLTLEAGEKRSIRLDLDLGVSVNGIVYDSDGIPLDDVLVTAMAMDPFAREPAVFGGPGRSGKDRHPAASGPSFNEWSATRNQMLTGARKTTRSDGEGVFEVTGLLPDDALCLGFWKRGFRPEILTQVAISPKSLYVEMHREQWISGVVFEAGTLDPVPSFTVNVIEGRPGPSSTDKNNRSAPVPITAQSFRSEEGLFSLGPFPPGPYRIHVTSKGFLRPDPVDLDITPLRAPPFLEWALDPCCVLKGSVVGTNKEAVSGILIHLDKKTALPPLEGKAKAKKKGKRNGKKKTWKKGGNSNKNSSERRESRTDSKGRFVFEDLEPGEYALFLGEQDQEPIESRKVFLTKGTKKTSAVILSDLAQVEISVEDGHGFSLAAEITLIGGPAKAHVEKRTDPTGTVRFSNLLPGNYEFEIKRKGFVPVRKVIILRQGKNDAIDVTLETRAKG